MMRFLTAFTLIALSGPALALSCAPREHVIAKLQDSYSEELVFGGLQKTRGKKAVMEVWASRENGTYTVLVTQPNGIACIVAVGTDFFEAVPAKEPTGDPL